MTAPAAWLQSRPKPRQTNNGEYIASDCGLRVLPLSSWWTRKKVRCEVAPTFYTKSAVFSHTWAPTCCSTHLWIYCLCSVSDLVWIRTQKLSKWLPLRNQWVKPRVTSCQNGTTIPPVPCAHSALFNGYTIYIFIILSTSFKGMDGSSKLYSWRYIEDMFKVSWLVVKMFTYPHWVFAAFASVLEILSHLFYRRYTYIFAEKVHRIHQRAPKTGDRWWQVCARLQADAQDTS